MNKYTKLTSNFLWSEAWSSIRLVGVTFKRAVEPCDVFIDNIKKTATNAQIVRDRLNEVYGDNKRIGARNSKGEIYIIANSWWRTRILQYYLFLAGKSTVRTSKHQLGIAIDIKKIRGLSVRQLRNFIANECDTEFSTMIEYLWGLHLHYI